MNTVACLQKRLSLLTLTGFASDKRLPDSNQMTVLVFSTLPFDPLSLSLSPSPSFPLCLFPNCFTSWYGSPRQRTLRTFVVSSGDQKKTNANRSIAFKRRCSLSSRVIPRCAWFDDRTCWRRTINYDFRYKNPARNSLERKGQMTGQWLFQRTVRVCLKFKAKDSRRRNELFHLPLAFAMPCHLHALATWHNVSASRESFDFPSEKTVITTKKRSASNVTAFKTVSSLDLLRRDFLFFVEFLWQPDWAGNLCYECTKSRLLRRCFNNLNFCASMRSELPS